MLFGKDGRPISRIGRFGKGPDEIENEDDDNRIVCIAEMKR